MARIRSPNYPGISLADAVERIHKIHGKAHTHKVDAATMAGAAGYSGLNGAALGVLSALKKYGLLEDQGKTLRVSDLALTIIADPIASPGRRAAVQKAAFSPPLFSAIRAEYPGAIPGDDIVRSYLLKKGFAATAIGAALDSFRETMKMVTSEGLGYNESLSDQESEDKDVESGTSNELPKGISQHLTQKSTFNAGTEVGTYPVSADCKIKLIATGPYDKTSIEALVKQLQLNLQLGVFQTSAKASEKQADEAHSEKQQLRRLA